MIRDPPFVPVLLSEEGRVTKVRLQLTVSKLFPCCSFTDYSLDVRGTTKKKYLLAFFVIVVCPKADIFPLLRE